MIDLTKNPAYMSVNELRHEVIAHRMDTDMLREVRNLLATPEGASITDHAKRLMKRIDELETFIEEIDHQYEAMQQIKSWCKAYPHDIFPEPDWVEAREKLGDSLLSRVSAANMRHVTEGIVRIITECEKNHTQ